MSNHSSIQPTNDDFNNRPNLNQHAFDQQPLSIIFNHQNIKTNKNIILNLTRKSENVTKEVKNVCKILHFSSEWKFDDVLTAIDRLNSNEYPQLFCFIIEASNFENQQDFSNNLTKLQDKLLMFSTIRPLVFQLTSIEKNITKIYYKYENSLQFNIVNQQDKLICQSSFESLLHSSNNVEDENEFFETIQKLNCCSLTLRLVRTLELTDGFFGSLVLDTAANGTKSEFMAALDASFVGDGRIINSRAQKYISCEFGDDGPANDDSVFLRAIQNSNLDVIDYLITYWICLIQQLDFEHKVRISTAAFETNQLDVLCDLLNIADYPFPNNFQVDSIEHLRLKEIITERAEFIASIEIENFDKINEFINKNIALKFIFTPPNNSMLTEAIKRKKFAVFYYLKSLDFKGEMCKDILEKLNDDEKKQAVKQATEQRKSNVKQSATIAPKAVLELSKRSTIHNNRTNKLQKDKLRNKIIMWLEAIHKIAPELINVASSCEKLKIIFDFESEMVENVSLAEANAAGSTYPLRKWIFIGAMLTDVNGFETNQRDQKIKGVLAHELCHYVMRLVYENQENPYYNQREDIKNEFEGVVLALNKWSQLELEDPDDECNGIISSVFKDYELKDFHPELIVRVVHILVEFDDNEEKSKYLQDKFKILFDFWQNRVLPDLRAFNLKSRESVRKINRIFKLLARVKHQQCNFNDSKLIKNMFDNKFTIVTSNVPMLLLTDIYNHLKDEDGEFFDTKNVFVDPKILRNEEILSDFIELLEGNPELNIIVDCSSILPENLKDFQRFKTIFVMSNETQLNNFTNCFQTNLKEVNINYNWSDLTQESQDLLVKTKVCFQNITDVPLLELLMPKMYNQDPNVKEMHKSMKNQILREFTAIVDDQLLNMMTNGSGISINVDSIVEPTQLDNNFEYLFIEREFIKTSQKSINMEISKPQSVTYGLYFNNEGQMVWIPNISKDQLLYDVKDKPVVLISDIAGNGKSWAMKNIINAIKNRNTSNWVTYVDLKQYIDEFKTYKGEVEFATFMVKHILKIRQQFEAHIFQKFYMNGKLLIFFDGFDEIAPDYAEFVLKLAQNFKQNGGNQLWISTREYFEVNLKQKLNTDAVYKMREMRNDEAVNLIAQSWLLMENGKKFVSKDEFNNYIKNPDEKYLYYLQKAIKIVQKLFSKFLNLVGMPHLLAMVTECYQHDKDGTDLNVSTIFERFMDRQYEKWSSEKGRIRKDANTQSLHLDLNFFELHQYYAIAVLFPEYLQFLFPDCDASEWKKEEIVACGLMSILGDKIFFIHATYCDFFVANLIAKGLKKPKVNGYVMEIFIKILTIQKFAVIRGLINDMINASIMDKIQPKLENLIKYFEENSQYKFESFLVEIFANNLDQFIDFALNLLKNLEYDNMKNFLLMSLPTIAIKSYDSKSFWKFINFMFDVLTNDDLKDSILITGMFPGVLQSNLEFDVFEKLLMKVEEKFNKAVIKSYLGTCGSYGSGVGGNVFHFMSLSLNFNASTLQKVLKIYERYMSIHEMSNLLQFCNEYGHNILVLCTLSPSFKNIKLLWQEIESFYSKNSLTYYFKELVKKKDKEGLSVLDFAIFKPDIDFHEDFWEVLLKTFNDRQEFKALIFKTEKISNKRNIRKSMDRKSRDSGRNSTTDENISNDQKKTYSMNILQNAIICSKDVNIHQFIWKIARNACDSNAEFFEILNKVDPRNENILHYCSRVSTKEIFEFIIHEIEKLTTRDKIRTMLSHLQDDGFLLMHCCAAENPFLDLHPSIWNTMSKYFDKLEIRNFIQQKENNGNENILTVAISSSSLQIIQIQWNEIKKFLTYDEQVSYLKMKNKNGENMLKKILISKKNDKMFKSLIEWTIHVLREYKLEIPEISLLQEQ